MELMQGVFAVKLCEMEEFYGRLQSRIQLCQAKEPAALRQALEETLDEAAAHRLLLKQRTREGRLPAAAALAQAQLDYERQADQIRLRLERELCGQDAAERKAEAAVRLARLEDMVQALTEEQEAIPDQLAQLRAQGKDRTVRFRELMARKLTLVSLRTELERYGLW